MSDYIESLSEKLVASEKLHKAMFEIGVAIRKILDAICEAVGKVVKVFVKTIKFAFYGIAPPKVRHLALYHKSERVRKKNQARIWRILNRVMT